MDHITTATYTAMVPLVAQQLYTIQLDYHQNTNNAVAQLAWSSPSTAQTIIPQAQLYDYTNPPPGVVLNSPVEGAQFTAPASLTFDATADAQYNPLVRVEFYSDGALVATLTNSPYTFTVTGVAEGSPTLTAVAVDGSGLSNTSAPVHITVNAGSGLPYGVSSRPTAPPYFNMPPTILGSLPPLLSEVGVFSDTTNMTAANSLIPYNPNVPLWSDGAVKTRWVSVPYSGGLLTPDQQIGFATNGEWSFPSGTVFVKHFALVTDETDTNVPLRRLETRLLVRDPNGSVYGVTYKWRPDNSDADLLTGSLSEDVLVTNATGIRTQTWYYPSPTDCLVCHTPVANFVLGVKTRQLNGDIKYPQSGVTDNQLRTLNQLGLFNPSIDEAQITNYSKMSHLTNLTASVEDRFRSYIDANCAQCHRPGGTGPSFDARYDTPLAGQSRNVGVAGGVHCDAYALIETGASEKSGVEETAAGGIELGHEGISGTNVVRLESTSGRGEVDRFRLPRNVGVAGAVHCDGEAVIGIGSSETAAAEISGVNQAAAGGIERGHKGIGVTTKGRLKSPSGRGKVH